MISWMFYKHNHHHPSSNSRDHHYHIAAFDITSVSISVSFSFSFSSFSHQPFSVLRVLVNLQRSQLIVFQRKQSDYSLFGQIPREIFFNQIFCQPYCSKINTIDSFIAGCDLILNMLGTWPYLSRKWEILAFPPPCPIWIAVLQGKLLK